MSGSYNDLSPNVIGRYTIFKHPAERQQNTVNEDSASEPSQQSISKSTKKNNPTISNESKGHERKKSSEESGSEYLHSSCTVDIDGSEISDNPKPKMNQFLLGERSKVRI